MIECTFSCGETRTRRTTRKLSSPSSYNELIRDIKVPKEFSRRSRDMDFAVFKAQEFRNIGLCFFPLIIQCIEPSAKERKVWLLLAYMLRSCVLPDPEFLLVAEGDIRWPSNAFYSLFQ